MLRIIRLGPALLCLFLAACGVKGPLQPPLVLTPPKIQPVNLSQRGTRLILDWDTPLVYENGVAMVAVPVVEIWGLELPLSPEGNKPRLPSAADFKKLGRRLAEVKEAVNSGSANLPASFHGTWEYDFDLAKLNRVVFVFSLRLRDLRGRYSPFSEPVSIVPVNVANPPSKLEVELKEDGILVRWQGATSSLISGQEVAAAGYNIYKKGATSEWLRLNSTPIQALEYNDQDVVMGRVYAYKVRAVVTVDSWPRESGDSAVLEVEYKDIFPPPAPTGVAVVISETAVVLSWEPSGAADLAGYRVRRRLETEADYHLLTAEPIIRTSFEDRQVEKGRSYYYAITACDKAGNESRSTEIKAVVIR